MTTPEHTYRPCAGCDSVGESCRAVGCPATPERDGAAVEAVVARWSVVVVESEHDPRCPGGGDFCADHCPVPVQRWLSDDEVTTELNDLIAAREAAAKAEAWREAAEEWPKMRGSHTRSDVAQWLRERADREAT